jgi:hypothetical protein
MAKIEPEYVQEPGQPASSRMRMWLWIVAGVMVVGLAGASFRYIQAQGDVTDLEQQLSDARAAASEIATGGAG